MASAELERAEKRLEQAKARVQAIKSRASVRERKLDTRRKIILGGALLERASRGDAEAQRFVLDVVDQLGRQADQAAFAEWTMVGKARTAP